MVDLHLEGSWFIFGLGSAKRGDCAFLGLHLPSPAALPSSRQVKVCVLPRVQANPLHSTQVFSLHMEGGVWEQDFCWLVL